jgi:hypothetical protein
MYMLFVIAFTILMLAGMDTRSLSRDQEIAARAEAIALQMATYHQAAVRACFDDARNACGAGVVNPAGELPAQATGQTGYGRFRSMSDGTGLVVTVFSTNDQSLMRDAGSVSAAFRDKLRLTAAAGLYDAANNRIAGQSIIHNSGVGNLNAALPGVGGASPAINCSPPVIGAANTNFNGARCLSAGLNAAFQAPNFIPNAVSLQVDGYPIPATVGGIAIPDGTPIIASRM